MRFLLAALSGLRRVLAVFAAGAALAFLLSTLDLKPAQPEPAPPEVGGSADLEAGCRGIDDCNDDGIPDDLEGEIRREQRAQLAERYCEDAGDDFAGGSEACFEGVVSGEIEVDPVDVYGLPEGEPAPDYYPEPSFP